MDEPGSVELHDMRTQTVQGLRTQHSRRRGENNCHAFHRKLFTPWVIMHMCGGLVMCLPIALVFTSYQECHTNAEGWGAFDVDQFAIFSFVCLLHFCSFTQLSWLMKASIELFWFVGLVTTLLLGKSSSCIRLKNRNEKMLTDDIVMCLAIQFLLILLLNHIHEKGVRANFYGDKEAAEQKNVALEQKEVADLLIRDMFPSHVSEQLQSQNTTTHSQNYNLVGILFASITNFYEFYEENFEGGIECIRVLHEIVADFDKLLDKYEYVEKIKTVSGTTFMAASGLNSKITHPLLKDDTHKYLHLQQLVDFALDLRKTLDEFNTNMLGFAFRLRCGFNAGPVTAGVIGTMKPQYDIWGDTVNLASRMDSTGVPDKIQVAEDCMKKLTDFFSFEPRGEIPVKGKGQVLTYLLTGKVDGVHSSPT